MEAALFTSIVGAVVSLATQLAKKLRIPGRLVVAVFSIGAAGLFTAYNLYLPEELRQATSMFFVGTWGTAVMFYDYFLKNLFNPVKE